MPEAKSGGQHADDPKWASVLAGAMLHVEARFSQQTTEHHSNKVDFGRPARKYNTNIRQ